MEQFKISDVVMVNRDIHAGRSEDGQFVCNKGTNGVVVAIESTEWDGIHVKLGTGTLWWFKPSQLIILD